MLDTTLFFLPHPVNGSPQQLGHSRRMHREQKVCSCDQISVIILMSSLDHVPDQGSENTAAENRPEILKLYELAPYIAAIMDPTDTAISRLKCPLPHPVRYGHLRTRAKASNGAKIKYFFALDLRESFKALPRLLGSIVEAATFLGPSNCAISIVEGHSRDGTLGLLEALKPELEKLGLQYFLQSSIIDPKDGDRIAKLAELRNVALAPLESDSMSADGDTTVIFLNDVAICMDDILELLHQRIVQSADMTCAMDWVYVGNEPTFYDVWVARTMKGETFFRIPDDGSWNWAWNLFWNDPVGRQRFNNKMPFQVFACWNGAVAFKAAPILGLAANNDGNGNETGTKVSFRAPREGECRGGEPGLFCKDLWWNGFGRIAVVPSVNLVYSDEAAGKIKDAKGYASKWLDKWDDSAAMIDWVDDPPNEVKCMPGWEFQSWRPWNETLT